MISAEATSLENTCNGVLFKVKFIPKLYIKTYAITCSSASDFPLYTGRKFGGLKGTFNRYVTLLGGEE